MTITATKVMVGESFLFQAEDGIRDKLVTWSSDVCSSDLTVVPALLAIALALVARRLLPWRAGPGTALLVGSLALALAAWPLAAWPFGAARSHATMQATVGPAYPNGLRTPSSAALRPSAFSLLDYAGGVAVG